MYNFNGIYHTDSSPGDNDKKTIVFLHGFFMDSRMFKHQVEHFKSQYRVVCFDFRGFGQTEWDNKAFTLDDLVCDVINTLEHLGIIKIILAGMSMGGYVAQRIALIKPNLVDALILIATQAESDNPETISSYHQLRDNWNNVIVREQIVNTLLPVIIGDDEYEQSNWKKVWLSYQQENIYHPMTAMTTRNAIDVSKIELPCLVLHGKDDVGIPLQAAQMLHDALPNSTMVIVEGACHAVNLTHPVEVNAAINQFLK
ncbi:alpha/beta fold hydrolase [Photobacterium kishitanii]|uniref:alpha/beta fold hydrolase n=1 Tax=Photobacterium kishitanii TaxID=318456 RepID=UPI00071AF0E4|nr:alpha/beta hydrolase [Photobacterium kishitanii]